MSWLKEKNTDIVLRRIDILNAKSKNELIILVMLSFVFCVVVLPAQAAQKPVADLSVSKTSGDAPLKVTFTDKSTGGKALWKWWGFGDGTGSSSTSNTVTHTYTKPGKYTVFLKATNTAGSSTKTYSVPIIVGQKPVADFSVTPVSGNAPLTVTFKDKSTGGKALWKWWGFGDGTGSSSTSNTVTHTYTKPGKYTVFLKVTNAAGSDTKTDSVPITVTEQTKSIVTDWGFSHENDYNEIIVEEIAEVWDDSKHPIDPLYVKAIIATESSFNKDAKNSNYCGLMQTPIKYDYSKIHAGRWNDPRTSIHVGLITLKGKMKAMSASSIYYNKKKIGDVGVIKPPSDNTELWNFVFASYNGGEGTVGNAMAYAKQMGRDPHIWKNIVEPQSKPEESPLYKAVLLNGWGIKKYNEINDYVTGNRGVRHWLSS